METKSIPAIHGAYPYYALNLARELRGLPKSDVTRRLKQKFGVRPGIVTYLYTGRRDWEGRTSSEFAETLRPLVAGIRQLGAIPKLLSCPCKECSQREKVEVAWELGIALFWKKDDGKISSQFYP